MANFITSLRFVFSLLMLFFSTFSKGFYVFYLLSGFTDMIDGTIARKTNTVSEFGSKLDTAADFVFVVICLIKLLPVMHIPIWLYVFIGLIAIIKFISLGYGLIVLKKIVSVHSVLNKITGALLFIFPLTLRFIDLKYSAVVVCGTALSAAVQEFYYVKTGKKR